MVWRSQTNETEKKMARKREAQHNFFFNFYARLRWRLGARIWNATQRRYGGETKRQIWQQSFVSCIHPGEWKGSPAERRKAACNFFGFVKCAQSENYVVARNLIVANYVHAMKLAACCVFFFPFLVSAALGSVRPTWKLRNPRLDDDLLQRMEKSVIKIN